MRSRAGGVLGARSRSRGRGVLGRGGVYIYVFLNVCRL